MFSKCHCVGLTELANQVEGKLLFRVEVPNDAGLGNHSLRIQRADQQHTASRFDQFREIFLDCLVGVGNDREGVGAAGANQIAECEDTLSQKAGRCYLYT